MHPNLTLYPRISAKNLAELKPHESFPISGGLWCIFISRCSSCTSAAPKFDNLWCECVSCRGTLQCATISQIWTYHDTPKSQEVPLIAPANPGKKEREWFGGGRVGILERKIWSESASKSTENWAGGNVLQLCVPNLPC